MSKINIVPQEKIMSKIFYIRNQKVMLDRYLAKLYAVETRRLNEQVKRNIERFPKDFMFQLTKKEYNTLISHFATSKRGGVRKLPYVFTEHGILMLSSVLKSKRAIEVNIQIMRTFTKLRKMLSSHKDLKRKIEEMENKYDKQFVIIFEAIKKLIEQPVPESKPIGFRN